MLGPKMRDMRTLKINPATRIYLSVSGRPGTFGATVYNSLFAKHNIDAVYLPRLAPDPQELCRAIRTLGISGCSVSTPLKSSVIPFIDRLDPSAQATQSVNTIVNQNKVLSGFNADLDGIRAALGNGEYATIRIFGAGSVVGSLLYVLRETPGRRISVVARNAAATEKLQKEHGLARDDGSHVDLLINATPASLDPAQSLLFQQIQHADTVFDLLVSPKPTPLLEAASRAGKKTIAGLSMAKGQFRRQFEIYTGISPSAEEIDAIVAENY